MGQTGKEAIGYINDPSYETPFLDALADERGIDRVDLINRVIAKVDTYNHIVGTLTGKRQRLEDQIEAASSIEELENIDWD